MDVNINVYITYIVEILGGLVALGIIYLLPKFKKYLTTRLTGEQLRQLEELIVVFVKAADQQFKLEDETGEKRKAYVEKQVLEAGYALTEQINSMIESAVYELKNGGK